MNTRRRNVDDNLMTLRAHLNRKNYIGPGDCAGVLGSLTLACKAIANKVRRARIIDLLGEAGETNVQGEEQQKLDVIANDILVHCLMDERDDIALIGSEEEEEVILLKPRSQGGQYCVLFDPLDGSSNIDVGVPVGTIFSVLHNVQPDERTAEAVLQPGFQQVAAGYVLYGSSVIMVLAMDHGVDMFVLDPNLGSFVLVKENLRIPDVRKIYSVNEANRPKFPVGYQRYLDYAHENEYSCRYIGSMVADIHRTLIKGGVFVYPPTANHPQGKLRLLYEGNPMAMVIEKAGGQAYAGKERLLDLKPERLHERASVVMGSKTEVQKVLEFV